MHCLDFPVPTHTQGRGIQISWNVRSVRERSLQVSGIDQDVAERPSPRRSCLQENLGGCT